MLFFVFFFFFFGTLRPIFYRWKSGNPSRKRRKYAARCPSPTEKMWAAAFDSWIPHQCLMRVYAWMWNGDFVPPSGNSDVTTLYALPYKKYNRIHQFSHRGTRLLTTWRTEWMGRTEDESILIIGSPHTHIARIDTLSSADIRYSRTNSRCATTYYTVGVLGDLGYANNAEPPVTRVTCNCAHCVRIASFYKIHSVLSMRTIFEQMTHNPTEFYINHSGRII